METLDRIPAEDELHRGLSGRLDALHSVQLAASASEPHSLVVFGIDNFRQINARYGSRAGDGLLLTLVAAFAEALAPAVVHRLGGDIFATVVAGDAEAARYTADRMLAALRAHPITVGEHRLHVTVSAGVRTIPTGADAGGVLLEADLAMAAAKAAGRDRAEVFSASERVQHDQAMAWGEAIRTALEGEGEGFLLHGQPVRDLRTDATQWELLLRLRQEGGRLLGPNEFLPVAERFSLGQRVDAWVLDRGVELVRAAASRGQALDVEINITARSLASDGFFRRVQERLVGAGIPASRLIFELSEANVGDVRELRHWVIQLRELGCRFALDNFGAETGALSHLRHLPLDFVKIDGDVIRHVADDRVDQQVVRSIVGLGHDLGLRVVAVHVGEPETLEKVRELGVDLVQGFAVGRPVPVEQIA